MTSFEMRREEMEGVEVEEAVAVMPTRDGGHAIVEMGEGGNDQRRRPALVTVNSTVYRDYGFVDRRDGMSWFGNLVWMIVCGGLAISLVYAIVGGLFVLTFVGAPCGYQLIKLASLALLPFGREVRRSDKCTEPSCDSFMMTLGNVAWFPFGLVLVLIHVLLGMVCMCTIILIPFAYQHFKLAQMAVAPFGSFDDLGLDFVEYETTVTTRTTTPLDEIQTAIPYASELTEEQTSGNRLVEARIDTPLLDSKRSNCQ